MPDDAERPSSQRAWTVLAILTLASISANIDQVIMTLMVKPIERDLHITDVEMSYLNGLAFAVFFALLGLPIARLADRSNRRNLIAGGVGLWSMFTAAGALAKNFVQLFLTRIGVGVGEASLYAPGVSLLGDYFPRERLARATSVFWIGIYFGSGAGYFIGGWLVGAIGETGLVTLPLLGAIHPWQTVFLAVGLPGVVIAALLLLVREPRRARRAVNAPMSETVRHIAANRGAFATLSFGFGASATLNYALAAWLATFFQRTYGWSAADAGRVQGTLTMTLGTAAVVAGGTLADAFVRRGRLDGSVRVGIIATIGMLLFATALPLMPTASLAVAMLAIVNVFAALPFGAAAAAAARITPVSMRAEGVALCFLVVNLVSRILGPSSAAWLTEYVFHDPMKLRYSLAIVSVAATVSALAIFTIGIGSYRRAVADLESGN